MCKLHNISSQVPSSASMALRHNYQLEVLFQTLQTDRCDYWLCCKLSEFVAWSWSCVLHEHIMRMLEGVKSAGIVLTDRMGKYHQTYGSLIHWAFWRQSLERSLSQSCTHAVVREPSCTAQNRAGVGRGAGKVLIMTIQGPVLEHHLVPHC